MGEYEDFRVSMKMVEKWGSQEKDARIRFAEGVKEVCSRGNLGIIQTYAGNELKKEKRVKLKDVIATRVYDKDLLVAGKSGECQFLSGKNVVST